MHLNWRKKIAASVIAITAAMGWSSAEARTSKQDVSAAGALPAASVASPDADEQTPSERAQSEERGERAYCRPIETTQAYGAQLELSDVQAAIGACRFERQRDVRRGDDNTRWMSRGSALGAFGGLVSGFTSQAVGTTNAWFAFGVLPILADDVMQRERVSNVRREFIVRLDQLQCRASFLADQVNPLLEESERLERMQYALEGVLADALDARSAARAAASGNGQALDLVSEQQYDAIISEALRLVEEVGDLRAHIAVLASRPEIARLEAISYNYLSEEYQRMRSRTLARPETTFRSVLAAPLRSAANLVGGPAAAPTEQFAYTRQVSVDQTGFSARYRVETSSTKDALDALNLRFDPPHYLLVPSSRRQSARDISMLAQDLSERAIPLRRALVQFVEAATNEDPPACPTYRLAEEPQDDSSDAPPAAPASPTPAVPATPATEAAAASTAVAMKE